MVRRILMKFLLFIFGTYQTSYLWEYIVKYFSSCFPYSSFFSRLTNNRALASVCPNKNGYDCFGFRRLQCTTYKVKFVYFRSAVVECDTMMMTALFAMVRSRAGEWKKAYLNNIL